MLAGGNVGGAVRVGDTVRRPAGRWTPTLQRLMRTLRGAGVEEVPAPLGTDDAGREVFSYIAGETVGAADRWPPWARSDTTLEQVGKLLRRVHDASRGFGGGAVLPWRMVDSAVAEGQVVCHHDLAPYNLVWRPEAGVVGLIDWDFAAPDDPRMDLAFAAWQFAPLHRPAQTRALGWPDDVDRAGRVRLLLDAYGLDARDGFSGFVVERMQKLAASIEELAAAGEPAFQRLIDRGDLQTVESSLSFVEELRVAIDDALTR